MEFKNFEKHMLRITKALDRSYEIQNLFDCEGIVAIYDELIDSIIDLLQVEFNDEDDWIGYWLFELDRGKKFKMGMVQIDGQNLPLTTIEDLYGILQ